MSARDMLPAGVYEFRVIDAEGNYELIIDGQYVGVDVPRERMRTFVYEVTQESDESLPKKTD